MVNGLTIKFKNFLWRLLLKYAVNPNKVVNVHGMPFHLDSKDSLLLSLRNRYEKDHVQLMKKIVKKGDWVVDIGAHIGYYTLLLSQLVGPEGKVFAFEPNPENFSVLRKNVEKNKLKNVSLYNKAVSNSNEKVKMSLSNINSGDSRIYNPKKIDSKESNYIVDSVKLDDFLGDNKSKIKFFKMDIQGAEVLAFDGMKEILKNKKLKFTTEFSPKNIESIEKDSHRFLKFIRENGFSLYDLDAKKKVKNDSSLIKYYKKINYFTTLYGFK